MAHALSLTASSSGRAPVPTGDGSTLLVDEANAIMICVAPIPSAWDPEGLALYRGGQRVTTPPMSDGTRWVLMGEERFGTFQARATGAGAPVASPVVRVVPATVSLRADRASAGQPGQGSAAAGQQGQGQDPAGQQGQGPAAGGAGPAAAGQPGQGPAPADQQGQGPAILPLRQDPAAEPPRREDPATVQPVATPVPVGPAQNVSATPPQPAGVGATDPSHRSSTVPGPPAGVGTTVPISRLHPRSSPAR